MHQQRENTQHKTDPNTLTHSPFQSVGRIFAFANKQKETKWTEEMRKHAVLESKLNRKKQQQHNNAEDEY